MIRQAKQHHKGSRGLALEWQDGWVLVKHSMACIVTARPVLVHLVLSSFALHRTPGAGVVDFDFSTSQPSSQSPPHMLLEVASGLGNLT